MAVRHREEVLNTVLAEVLIARGMNASPESIKRKGAQRPDVLISFRGLRCAIEGKIADVQNAREIVAGDAQGRVDTGLTHIAIGVVYPEPLRRTSFNVLGSSMSGADYSFCICTEMGIGEWQSGTVDEILNAMRRAHETLATDDAVRKAADELSVGLTEIANVFTNDKAVCDRLIDLLGIGSQEAEDDDSD